MLLEQSHVAVSESSLAAYFRARISQYAASLKPPPHVDTCWYLGSLLERFGRSDQVFAYEEGHLTLPPLAFLYGDALQAYSQRQRCLIFRQLGDLALFLGALFPKRFARRGIHRDYFIAMGGQAYNYLAEHGRDNRHIFSELASTFGRMLELVAKTCSRTQGLSASDVLDLYQRWRDTRDPLIAGQLQALGIQLSERDTLQ